jgi:hypothetical protein
MWKFRTRICKYDNGPANLDLRYKKKKIIIIKYLLPHVILNTTLILIRYMRLDNLLPMDFSLGSIGRSAAIYSRLFWSSIIDSVSVQESCENKDIVRPDWICMHESVAIG